MKVHYIAGVGYDSNVYLIEDDDPIVVDAGTGMYAESTLEEIAKKVPLDKVGRIVLTHCHYDHIGGAAEFQKRTGGRIYLHEAEAEPIMSGDPTLAIADMFGEQLRELDVQPLKAGQKLKCGSSSFDVLHTPGHSPGSIVLHDKTSGSAVVGDTVFCDGGVGRWDMPGGNLEELISSLRQLGKLELKNMYPGHGSYAEGDAQKHLRMAANYLQEAF